MWKGTLETKKNMIWGGMLDVCQMCAMQFLLLVNLMFGCDGVPESSFFLSLGQ